MPRPLRTLPLSALLLAQLTSASPAQLLTGGLVPQEAETATGNTGEAADTADATATADTAPPPPPAPAPPLRGWTEALDWLSAESRAFAEDLELAHTALTERATLEDPAQLERLTPEPPSERPHGYGILPEVRDDAAIKSAVPAERRYSIKHSSTAYASYIRDGALLAVRSTTRADMPLPELVDEFVRLRKMQSQLQEHVSYHEFWQERVVDEPEPFVKRNETLAQVRAWDKLRRRGDDPDRARDMRLAFEQRLGRFESVDGLATHTAADGTTVLPVRVLTDIEDAAFLAQVERAVREAFVDSDAARTRSFRIELVIEAVAPAELYPEGAPEHGAHLDEADHRARFPDGLVLTTGAASTHAYIGRCIQLGPDPIARRTLAHEFCHLLGFKDAYLRGCDGDPAGPFGSVIVEWVGLFDDLLGSSSRGRVTTDMIDQLVDAYGPAESP